MANKQDFYVYEHWRLDNDECFYVGKGKKNRAYSRSGRNSHWHNIVNKLERTGFAYEVRIVASGLTEEEAFNLEIERIAFWKNISDLANKTNGGDGVSGLIMSDESRKKMSEKAKGRIGNKTMLGRKHSEATREKMRLAQIGKRKAPEHIAKVAKANLGKKLSEEHKQKLSISAVIRAKRGISNLTRQKLSEAARKQWADPERRPVKVKVLGV